MAAGRSGLIVATSWRSLLGHSGLQFEHRAARTAELRRVLPEADHNPIGVRYQFAAKPEDIRGAGHLLFKGPAILLGKSGIVSGNAADDRCRNAQGNRVHSHVRSFSRIQLARLVPCCTAGFKMNAAGESSRRTTKCEVGQPPYSPAHGRMDSKVRALEAFIPGRVENANPESLSSKQQGSPICDCTSEVWSFAQSRNDGYPYSTLPIFFTAPISRALSSVTNFENSGASM